MNTVIYGIKNCDTMKKAMNWLDSHGVDYQFHNYKKDGIDEYVLKQAIEEHGWERVINKRGTTWKQLPPTIQTQMDEGKAIEIAKENPSIIKRPLLLRMGQTVLGFDPKVYSELF